MRITYKYRINLSNIQRERIDGWIGACRLIYNMALYIKKDAYNKGIPFSFSELSKQLPSLRAEYKWMKDVPAGTLQKSIRRADNSFKRFFSGCGYPKFKSKKDANSFSLTQHSNILRYEGGGYFNIEKIGKIKIFLDRVPKGVIVGAIIKREINKYYICINSEVQPVQSKPCDSQVGIDLGLSNFAVTSDGSFIKHPRLFENQKQRLIIAQRKLSRMKKNGKNREKQVLLIKKIHQKIKRQRADFLQKESTKIVSENKLISVENLNISGMIKSKLSAKISDSGWGYFLKMLRYKAQYLGREYVEVSARNSSQECFLCGYTSSGNRKNQKDFECENCGHKEHADYNAAQNILRRGQRLLTQSTDNSLRLVKEPEFSGSHRHTLCSKTTSSSK